MKEQTGDLQALKEARFKEINAKLKHLHDLSFNELKYLYNELHASKEDYINYMAKLEIKEDKVSRIALFLTLILSVFLLGWMMIQGTPLIVKFIEIIFIFLVGVDCYQEFITKPRKKFLDKYQDDITTINDLILKEEREEDRVVDVALTKETQEQSVDLNKKNNEELETEELLTLKRDLNKKDKEI